ncbi:2-amino-4-hydroxy-6-hydroxymethyldihydropteridine diphosphokinase [Novosphingobium sp.]|uniref:2-amino-4-hydroxy-6- hydroxymethyldihydropteridine diphosphokinase n=1 Tax=Novosphingobium sp. TaxID=1874826 RepID=UPI0027359BD1|nr:2-amino-4-hydroxy-6-hydroxymethyldihydropteridine diphosphokinase [Novosphingobium sp.]MDP3906479.1 2-amino-4-hydroxy-6-hydroxymethyldihydropteridine diphosphokinase [Novosphingobium sp.]
MGERYLIALGSNQRHVRHGAPERVLTAALAGLEQAGIRVVRTGPIVRSAPIGPSHRRYANSAAVVETDLRPDALLTALKQIERAFGRTQRGQRWSSRVLDLDIVLRRGGAWSSPGLTVPHIAYRTRDFVLAPALPIAADWRDPLGGGTIRQLHRRLKRAKAITPA